MNRVFQTFRDLSAPESRALWAGLSSRGGTLTSSVQVLETPGGPAALDISTPRLNWLPTADGETHLSLTLNVLDGLVTPVTYVLSELRTEDGEVTGEGLRRVFDVTADQAAAWETARRAKRDWRVQWDLTLSDPLRFAPFDVLTALPVTFDRTFFGLFNGQLRDRVPGTEGLILGCRTSTQAGAQQVNLREVAVYATFAWRAEFPTDLNIYLDGLPFVAAQSGTLPDTLNLDGSGGEGTLPAWARLSPLLTAAQRLAVTGEALPVRPDFQTDAALAACDAQEGAGPFVDLAVLTLRRAHAARGNLPVNLQTSWGVAARAARVATGLSGLLRRALRLPAEDLGHFTAALLGAMHLERYVRLFPGELDDALRTYVADLQSPLVLRGLLRAAQDPLLPLSERVAAGALVGLGDRLGSAVAYVASDFTFLHEQQEGAFRPLKLPVTGEHKPVLMTAPGAAGGRADLRVLAAWREMVSEPGAVPAAPFDFASTLLYYWNDDKSPHTTAKSVAFKVRWTG
jgi:hypothetical protein